MKQRVYITGMSLCSPLGSTLAEFSERMFQGESGVSDIRGKIVPENFPVPYAGLIKSLQLPSLESYDIQSEIDIISEHLVKEIAPALKNLDNLDGFIFGSPTSAADFSFAASVFQNTETGYLKWKTYQSAMPVLTQQLSKIGINLKKGNSISAQATCITGNVTIGHAFSSIRSGRWNNALVGTMESRIRAEVLMPLYLLGALSTEEFPCAKASRPFDLRRCGFVRSEGGGLLLLESESSMLSSGAEPYAEVIGFSQTSDAWRLTDERPDLKGAVKAIETVLCDAQLQPKDVDYINAHGTSTKQNDRLETAAIKKIFDQYAFRIPISSLKSQVGHLNMACGTIEAIATVLMLNEQKIAPTINLETPDKFCDLDYVPNKSRDARIKNAISNNFGFGGLNSCIALRSL